LSLNKLAKLISCLADPAYREALIRHRVAAGAEHEPVLRMLGCRTVIDIGANRGQFALAARRCFPNARIVSFEPLPRPAAQFRAVFASDARVTLHVAAIAPERGQATMHVSARDDSSSLLAINELQSRVFPGTAEADTARVEVGALEDYVRADEIEAPALLKLDVQGYELHALQGCQTLLSRFTYIYVECSFIELYSNQALADEVIGWLQKRGFGVAGVCGVAYDRSGRAIQADFFFRSRANTAP